MNNIESSTPARLEPGLESFRLLVLAFVREYIGLTGNSPSQGEIVNKFRSTRTRVRDALRSLERDGLIIRVPGHRGIRLPSLRDQAVKQLRELGWSVDEDIRQARVSGPNSTLLPPPELTYPKRGSDTGSSDDQQGGEEPGEDAQCAA